MVTIPLKQDFTVTPPLRSWPGNPRCYGPRYGIQILKDQDHAVHQEEHEAKRSSKGPYLWNMTNYCSLTWLNRDSSGRIAMDIDENYHE